MAFDAEELLTPGEVNEFRIILYPTANRFARGAPDSGRYLVIQLPAFRRQSQHRRAPRTRPPRQPRLTSRSTTTPTDRAD